jgi:hypothetical protein
MYEISSPSDSLQFKNRFETAFTSFLSGDVEAAKDAFTEILATTHVVQTSSSLNGMRQCVNHVTRLLQSLMLHPDEERWVPIRRMNSLWPEAYTEFALCVNGSGDRTEITVFAGQQ